MQLEVPTSLPSPWPGLAYHLTSPQAYHLACMQLMLVVRRPTPP